ncbi:site-specific integrase [Oscillospiraceae bacterium MB08-C2-2]|nr:site-specific integrase [Oscillospiraceae bacterium MB08-C2-2]
MSRKGENIYKRKDGRWEGRLLKPDGRYQYFYAKSYREVRIKMREAPKHNVNKNTKAECNKLDAADLFETWLTGSALNRVKPSTYESYYYCIYGYVIPHFSLADNREMTSLSIARFVNKVANNASISETYRKKILSIFKLALREICKSIPESASLIEAVTLPKVIAPKEISIFSIKEQRLIEHTVESSKNKKALGILICFYTGIRLGELCALKWRDIDFEAGTVCIRRTVSRIRNFDEGNCKTLLHVGTPKSRSSLRKIPLPTFLISLLNNMHPSLMNDDCYILTGNSEPYDPRIYQRQYKKILTQAGVTDRKFHTIRHTFATRALELGVDIKTLSEILGHSNVSITLNVYAHSLMEHKKAAIDKFNEMHTAHM